MTSLKKSFAGRFAPNRLALAVVAAFALPAFADDAADLAELTRPQSVVEVGVGYVDEDSRKFGEYTGLKEKDPYFIGNVRAVNRSPMDASYWTFDATNLGLASRNVKGEIGRQGAFKVWAEYDQIPKYGQEAFTIFEGAGTDRLTLPAGFVGLTTADTGGTAAAAAARAGKIEPFLRPYDQEQERRNYIVGASGSLTRAVTAKISFRQEDKEGIKTFGATFGNSGGNPRAVAAPEPVDYTTRHIDASVGFNLGKLALKAGYYLSKFENNYNSFTYQNPYNAINGWIPTAGFPTGIGQIALAPDNEFHRFGIMGAYSFDAHTRLSFNADRGRATQNDPFLPYTADPNVDIHTPLPRSSADAQIDTTNLAVNLSMQPMRKLHLHAQVRYEDHDNKTPIATYTYIGGDSTVQNTPGAARTRTNMPLSVEKTVFKIGADYTLMPRTKLKLGYDWDQEKRDFSEVSKNTTNQFEIGLRRSMTDFATGSITYWRAKRDLNEYCYNCPYYQTYAAGAIPAPPHDWDNLPFARRFPYQERDQDKVRFALNLMPSDVVTVQFSADYRDDDYNAPIHGMQFAKTASYTVDLGFTPMERLSGYAYYTRDKSEYETQGLQFTSANRTAVGFLTESGTDWVNTGEDKGDTFGAGFKLMAIPKRLDLGLDLMYSKMDGRYDTQNVAGTALPLPELLTKLRSVKLFGTYKVNRDLALRLTYWYQKLESNDWAWDTITPTTIPNVITNGQTSPNYDVNFVGVSVIYRFR
jgi:MtrB/PioB family decaheme-associated outer membrane protein